MVNASTFISKSSSVVPGPLVTGPSGVLHSLRDSEPVVAERFGEDGGESIGVAGGDCYCVLWRAFLFVFA